VRHRRLDVDLSDAHGELAAEAADPAPRPGDEPRDFGSAVLTELIEAGIDASTAARVFLKIEPIITAERFSLASEALRRIAKRLGNTSAGVALERAIIGSDEPVREAARRAGVSHPAVIKNERRIRRAIAEVTNGR